MRIEDQLNRMMEFTNLVGENKLHRCKAAKLAKNNGFWQLCELGGFV
jgi:hypothetical protein